MDPNAVRLIAELLLFAAVSGAVVHWFLRRALKEQAALKSSYESQFEAQRKAFEAEQRSLDVRMKEELLELRQKQETEFRSRWQEIETEDARQRARDQALEERRSRIEEREELVKQSESQVRELQEELAAKLQSGTDELARIGKLSADEARQEMMASVEASHRDEAASRLRELEVDFEREAKDRAKKILIQSMERVSAEFLTEATVAVIQIPSEEMKGRLIGRDGRNIRAFEQATGVDLIIDDTPEAVVISSFDPVRREMARLALMNLMLDGRIHPGRIDELYERARQEVEKTIEEAGERAAEQANVGHLHPKVIEMMGRLRFRTSYAQNVLDHSVEVAHLAAMLAAELGANVELTKRAAFLHDIGKALPAEFEGPHAIIGMEFLREFEKSPVILNAVGAHHREIAPASAEAELIIIADGLSAARPGARRENLENYVKRLAALEALANQFNGVERSYAMQAGRELRIVVMPHEVDDLGAAALARDVARKIEVEMDFPGQVKVTVIRESRWQEIAK